MKKHAEAEFLSQENKISLMKKQNIYDKLRQSNIDSINLFSLDGIITWAKLVDIYDGDTCTMNIIFHDDLIQMKCRMVGYDSPEMKPLKTVKDRDQIKEKAIEAKNKLISYLCNDADVSKNTKLVLIKAGEFDKYGRLLVTAYHSDIEQSELKDFTFEESVNHQMIGGGYGYAYDGGKKQLSL